MRHGRRRVGEKKGSSTARVIVSLTRPSQAWLVEPLCRSIVHGVYIYTTLQKNWYLDVQNTPCARDALLYGIAGGLGVGLLYFMKSSEL